MTRRNAPDTTLADRLLNRRRIARPSTPLFDQYVDTPSIPSGSPTAFSWVPRAGYHFDGLLDLTTSTVPIVKASGLYAFSLSLWFSTADEVAGKGYWWSMETAYATDDFRVDQTGSLDPAIDAGSIGARSHLALTCYLQAGVGMFVQVKHSKGTNANPSYFFIVQRLS